MSENNNTNQIETTNNETTELVKNEVSNITKDEEVSNTAKVEVTNVTKDEPNKIVSKRSQLITLQDLSGIFCINKPVGLSSSDIVTIAKKKISNKLLNLNLIDKSKKKKHFVKIGHGGTLDPLATGCLVIGLYNGTKMLNSLLAGSKVYEAVGRLGSSTTTYDCIGDLVEEKPYNHVTKEKLEEVLNSFVGETEQIPPIYSALKIDGIPLYQYAMSGKPLPKDIKARKINIYKIELLDFDLNPTKTTTVEVEKNSEEYSFMEESDDKEKASVDNTTTTNAEVTNNDAKVSRNAWRKEKRQNRNRNKNNDKFENGKFVVKNKANANPNLPEGPTFRIRVECGGGTYIRSLIYDIGKKLESEAHMIELCRTKQGQFSLEDAISIKDCDDLQKIKSVIKRN